MTWGAAQLGIGQGVLDAVADGLIEATGDLLVLVAVWVDPGAGDETAVRVANREAVRKAIGTCVNGRDPGARHGSSPRGTPSPTRSTGASDADHRCRDDALPLPARPAVSRRLGPGPAYGAGRDRRRRPHRRGSDGLRERRPPARPRAARAAPRSGSTRSAPRSCARSSRRSTSTAAGPGRSRRRSGTWSAARSTRRSGSSSAAVRSGSSPTPRAASSSTRTSARAAASSSATGACARSSSASTTPTGATTSQWSSACARRSRSWRSWSTRTRAGGCPATASRAGTWGRPRSARARSSRSASTGSRSRSAPTTSTATRRCGASPRCGSPRARWRARRRRPATSCFAPASTSCRPMRCSHSGSAAAGGSPRSPISPAAPGRRTPGRTATGSSSTFTSRSRSRRCRTSRCRSTRQGGRPSGATGCCRRRSQIAEDGTVAPPPGPGLGVTPDFDALERWRVG